MYAKLIAAISIVLAAGPLRAEAAVTPVTGVTFTMLADDVVQGVGVPRARISVTPPVEGATVQVQRRAGAGWQPGGTVKTHAGGLVTVRFNLNAVGPAEWRAVVTAPVAEPVASDAQAVVVHAAPAPELSELTHALCDGLSEALAEADPEATSFANVKAFPATKCDRPKFAAAASGGLTEALMNVVAGTGTEPTWAPVLVATVEKARAALTDQTLLDAWVGTNRAHVAVAHDECLRAGNQQCDARQQAAEAALAD